MPTFKERFNYLKTNGKVGEFTFGGYRYLNQKFYTSDKWLSIRRRVIIRDDGCDLGLLDYPILGNIYIHHIEPVTVYDLMHEKSKVFDLDNLISTSFNTHNALHYGDEQYVDDIELITRKPNDTIPWR